MEPTLDYPAANRLTYRDLDDTPEDGNRYEVIDGALYVTPFPGEPHQNVIRNLQFVLESHVRANRLGKVYGPGLKVVLDEPTGVGPDLVFISTARMSNMREDGFYGPPDLVVEVLSSKPKLDTYVKFETYAASGIAHYWIADPRRRILDVFALEMGRYERLVEMKERGLFEPKLFPGFGFEVSDLWR